MIRSVAIICVSVTISVVGFARLTDQKDLPKSSPNIIAISDDMGELNKVLVNYFGTDVEVLKNSRATTIFQVKNVTQSEVTSIIQRSKDIENLRLHSLTLTPADISPRYNVKIVYAAQ